MSGLALNRFGQPLDEAADFAENDDAEGECSELDGFSFHDDLEAALRHLNSEDDGPDETEPAVMASYGLIGPHVDLSNLVEQDIIRKIQETGYEHATYYGSPNSYEELLEWIEEIVKGGTLSEARFAVRESCVTNNLVVMVYEKDGIQYHMETRKIVPPFDLRDLKRDVLGTYGEPLRKVDHYLSDL